MKYIEDNINVILYCAENNLALRGSSNDIDSKKTINLIAKHNPVIHSHVDAVKNPEKKHPTFLITSKMK